MLVAERRNVIALGFQPKARVWNRLVAERRHVPDQRRIAAWRRSATQFANTTHLGLKPKAIV